MSVNPFIVIGREKRLLAVFFPSDVLFIHQLAIADAFGLF